MTTKLTIRWDGTAPGLKEHALSIGAWHEAIGRLLTAVRRTASGMASEALEDPQYGARGGRLNKQAAEVDLQLVAIRHGCVDIDFHCVLPPQEGLQQDLFLSELPERAVERVLQYIEEEARGELRSAPVRKYLQALPGGVSIQEYRLEVDGREIKRVEVRDTNLPVPPVSLPGLRRVEGHVVAVSFEPGSSSVTLKAESGALRLAATAAQVDQALVLRERPIVAQCLVGTPARLLWLAAADSPPPGGSEEGRTRLFLGTWKKTLERLAR